MLHGRRPRRCISSVHQPAAPERKGLVLGLAPGGSVRGAAYRVAAADWAATYAYLMEREQPTETYVEAKVIVRPADGRRVEALPGFLSDVAHPQWAGRLNFEEQARLIAGSRGLSGRNNDYLRDLVEHLRHDGVRDAGIEPAGAGRGAAWRARGRVGRTGRRALVFLTAAHRSRRRWRAGVSIECWRRCFVGCGARD